MVYAMLAVDGCGMTRICSYLSELLGQAMNTLRHKYREIYSVPAEWTVLVMADRGLYAAWLFQAIQANGWHPFLRVKQKLSFRAEGEKIFGGIGERVRRTGRGWKGRGEWSEKGERMQGTVFVRWEKGYEEPICVVSDWPAEQGQAAWYQMRFWIEDEYKDGKRGWFHWEQTKMTKPERASRLWLVLSIVMQKAILVGGEWEATAKARPGKEAPTTGREEAPPRTARHSPEASAGTRTECPHARDHGPASRRDRWGEDPAARPGESRARALAPVPGEPRVQKPPVEETSPRRKEAQPPARSDQGQARATSAGASNQASGATGPSAGETGPTGGQTGSRVDAKAGRERPNEKPNGQPSRPVGKRGRPDGRPSQRISQGKQQPSR